MALHTLSTGPVGDDADDLLAWLRQLPGCPQVTHTVLATCERHGEDQPSWCYVEADAAAGVAKRRCVACGTSRALLDSDERWTFPPMFSCPTCAQSLVEIAAGVAAPGGPEGATAEWLALAARCVECGRIEGLTDLVLPRVPLDDVLGLL